MKKVIVPMDFTEVSLNAFDYAMKSFDKAEFEIVHVTKSLVELNEPVNNDREADRLEVLKDHLADLMYSEFGKDTFTRVKASITILHGDTVSQIRKHVEKQAYHAMVLGTRDKYDFFDRWIGTISLGLVKSLHLPIYLVPRYAIFKRPKRIMVASDFSPEHEKVVEVIKNWNEQLNAFIKFLHINRRPGREHLAGTEKIVNQLFANSDPTFGFELAVVEDRNISQSILSSAYNFKADLLIVIPENQSFIHSLLFKSLSKDLILQSAIPVLFIHKDDTL